MSCCRFYFRSFFHVFLLFCSFVFSSSSESLCLLWITFVFSSYHLFGNILFCILFHFVLLIFLKLHPSWPCFQHYPFYVLFLWHGFFFYNGFIFLLGFAFSRLLILFKSYYSLIIAFWPLVYIWVLVLKICFILNASSSQRRVSLSFSSAS